MSRAHNVVNKLQGLIDKSNNCTKKHDTDLHGAIDSLIEGFGKGEGGSGIIDVTELPTENIDTEAIYRITEEVNKEPEVYLYTNGAAYTIAEFFAMQGVTATVPIFQVAELPETMEPMDEAAFIIPLYVLESDGKAYLSIDGTSANAMTFGTVMGGAEMDKGWTDDISTVTETGVYCVRGEAYAIYHYWRYENNLWIQWSDLVDVDVLPTENILTTVCYRTYDTDNIAHYWTYNKTWIEWADKNQALVSLLTGTDSGLLTIPEGTTVIRPYACYGCNYTSVILPTTLQSIGNNAFKNCTNLTTIECNTDSSIMEIWNNPIANWADSHCTLYFTDKIITGDGFEYELLENNTYTLARNTNTSIEVATIPATVNDLPVTSISQSAFANNTNLKTVTIPTSINKIELNAFNQCAALEGVYITDINKWCEIEFGGRMANPVTYAHNLYLNNELVTNVTTPSTINTLNYTFCGCTSLTDINISEGVASITGTFYGCSGLENITLPDSVTLIGGSTFVNCNALTEITIPSSVTEIVNNAFAQNENLTKLNITDLQAWCNIKFNDTYSNPCAYNSILDLYLNNELITDIIIPEGVSKLVRTFTGCSKLTKVEIPGTVETIGYDAFYNCNSLQEVVLHEGTTVIGIEAFGSTQLTSIILPESLTQIGLHAFGNTSLQEINIPNNVTSIGESAFYNCTLLTSITLGENIKSFGRGAFENCTNVKTLNYNTIAATNMTKNNYRIFESLGTDNTGVTFTIGSKVTSIPNYLCDYVNKKPKITTIIFADQSQCKHLGISAFSYCPITSINLPNSLQTIGEAAFYGIALTALVLPNNITSLGTYAFCNCQELLTISFGTGLTSISNSCFSSCDKLLSIDLPSNITSISSYAFGNCEMLGQITLQGVKTISSYAFRYCDNLKEINLSTSITSIQNYAFVGCTALETVNYAGTEDDWSAVTIGTNNTSLTSATINYNQAI